MAQPTDDLPAREALLQMLPGLNTIQMLYVAARLGLADLLVDGPASVESLAAAAGAHAPSLYRLLRALASRGIFSETEPGQFALTPMAELLRADVPGSLRNVALWQGSPWHWRPAGELLHSVRTGETAFDRVFGMGLFDYLARDADAAAVFNQEMTEMTQIEGAAVASHFDFGQAGLVVDIGGGQGSLMAAILARFPAARGLIFDLPQVVEGAGERLAAAGVQERCQLQGGDFFQAVPAGGDFYLLKDIIHDWDDAQAGRILGNIRQVIGPRARLLLIERVIPPGNTPHEGKLVDISMLALTGGRERTEAEYRRLLQGAGFQMTAVVPTPAGTDLIEARPG